VHPLGADDFLFERSCDIIFGLVGGAGGLVQLATDSDNGCKSFLVHPVNRWCIANHFWFTLATDNGCKLLIVDLSSGAVGSGAIGTDSELSMNQVVTVIFYKTGTAQDKLAKYTGKI
jgi:hypothetical protein